MVGDDFCRSVTDSHIESYRGTYNYQVELTGILDKLNSKPFSESDLHLIVLWKANRYAALRDRRDVLQLVNSLLDKATKVKDCEKALETLLQIPGIALPMASTILRFRRPDLFPIIDKRAYAVVFPGVRLSVRRGSRKQKMDRDAMAKEICIYRKYAAAVHRCYNKLRKANLDIRFDEMDRFLYAWDKYPAVRNASQKSK